MFKDWKWIVGIFFAISAIVAVTAEQHNARYKYEKRRQEDCIALAISPDEKHTCAKEAQGRHDYMPWEYELLAWPEGITTWAVILTLGAFIWQATLMRKHADHFSDLAKATAASAKASEKSATAALLNAQAVVNAERALLLFSYTKEMNPKRPGEALFHVFVTNYGKSPARYIEVRGPIHCLMPLEDAIAVSPPTYEVPTYIHEYLVPGDKHEVATFHPAARWAEGILAATKNYTVPEIHNIIYGQITYFDGISADIRHSRYFYSHDRTPFSNIGGSLRVAGTDEYLECT